MPVNIREEFAKNWDWRRALPGWTYNRLVLDGLPGFDLTKYGDQYEHMCYFVMGDGVQSRDIAIEMDDWCTGMFYYADRTGGTPFVRDGDEYVSFFSFQLAEDYWEFEERYCKDNGPGSPEKLGLAAKFGRKKYGWNKLELDKYLIKDYKNEDT